MATLLPYCPRPHVAAALLLLFATNTEKPLPTFLKAVDAGIKDLMQKSFEQTKAALKDMPADQRDATCKAALDGLKGDAPAASPEDKA